MKAKPYLELILAAVFAVLTLATIIWPIWIELLTGVEPDEGSGQLERVIVAVFAVMAVLTVSLSRRDFRRARAAGTA